MQGSNLIHKVDELLDPYTCSWDDQLVRDLLVEEDAETILAIPVHEDMEDLWAWHYDPKGLFTIKSAYKLGRKLGNHTESSLEQPMPTMSPLRLNLIFVLTGRLL
jgi:hypothetical protein